MELAFANAACGEREREERDGESRASHRGGSEVRDQREPELERVGEHIDSAAASRECGGSRAAAMQDREHDKRLEASIRRPAPLRRRRYRSCARSRVRTRSRASQPSPEHRAEPPGRDRPAGEQEDRQREQQHARPRRARHEPPRDRARRCEDPGGHQMRAPVAAIDGEHGQRDSRDGADQGAEAGRPDGPADQCAEGRWRRGERRAGRRPPRRARTNGGSAGSICAASISSEFVTARVPLPQAVNRPTLYRVRRSCDRAARACSLAPPDHRVRELHDLEQVHHVHRGGEREQPEQRRRRASRRRCHSPCWCGRMNRVREGGRARASRTRARCSRRPAAARSRCSRSGGGGAAGRRRRPAGRYLSRFAMTNDVSMIGTASTSSGKNERRRSTPSSEGPATARSRATNPSSIAPESPMKIRAG